MDNPIEIADRPAAQDVLEDLAAPEMRQWMVTGRAEIVGVLTGLRAARARAQVYFSRAPGSIVTTVLDVDARHSAVVFDTDADPARNNALAGADALAWRALADGVRVEFTTGAPRWTQHGNAPAFVAPLPDVVLRLQRRNAYRAAAPVGQPLAVLADAAGDGRHEVLLRVLDISALGMCLLVDSTVLPVVADMRITRARFQLPGFGEIRTSLEVRYILSGGARQPSHYRRCGVQFRNLASADEVLISRYINALERDRARYARP